MHMLVHYSLPQFFVMVTKQQECVTSLTSQLVECSYDLGEGSDVGEYGLIGMGKGTPSNSLRLEAMELF